MIVCKISAANEVVPRMTANMAMSGTAMNGPIAARNFASPAPIKPIEDTTNPATIRTAKWE